MFRVLRRAGVRQPFRRFSSAPAESSTPKSVLDVPLTQPLPGFPRLVYATANERTQTETRVTTLSNGIRVASQAKFGQFCTIGSVIDTGSRYEVSFPSGVSHFLEKLSFQSTQEFAGRDVILQKLEKFGGICDCQITRESGIYAASLETEGYDGVLRILREATMKLKIAPEELDLVRQAIRFDLEDLQVRHEQEPILMELIHAAAYRDNTVGLPRICPAENVDKIDRSTLFTFLSQYYSPSRTVIAGVGIDHDLLVKGVEKHFLNEKTTWEEEPDLLHHLASKVSPDLSTAQYTGGDVRMEKDLSDISNSVTAIPEFVHFVLGFESCSYRDPDFVPFCVLNILMGGGGSFSAGGPGKGMYTRLYLNVLNQYHWINNATAYNHTYSDTGIFCIHASSDPAYGRQLVEVIVKEFKKLASNVQQEELARAKTQLSSMLMMNLESRPVIFEDIGRQVLAYGHRKPPRQLVQEIEAVTVEDIQRVAVRMLRTKPAVACLGKISVIPSYAEIESQLAAAAEEPKVKKARRFTVFS